MDDALRRDGWVVIRFWGEDIDKRLSWCADIVETNVRGYVADRSSVERCA